MHQMNKANTTFRVCAHALPILLANLAAAQPSFTGPGDLPGGSHYSTGVGTPCFSDLNNDGDTDSRDFIIYLARWAGQHGDDCSGYDCTADLDKNGTVDTRDLVRFLDAWATGC